MTPSRTTTAEKRRVFRELHESGCFVIPNPWDVGSARYLQSLGFKALASTSSGAAWSQGLPDNGLSRGQVLEHLRTMAAATDLPLNADFENGFAADAAGIGESVRLAVETGVAGVSIEDSISARDRAADSRSLGDGPLFPLEIAVERVRAARRAIDAAGGDVMLIGRAECFLVGTSRYRNDRDAAQGVRRRRSRLPLCAGHQDGRADPGGGRGRTTQARESIGGRARRSVARTNRGAGRAPRERRRRAGPRGVGRIHEGCPGAGRAWKVRRARRSGGASVAERALLTFYAAAPAWCCRNSRPRSAASTNPSAMNPQQSDPVASGSVVPLNSRPITAPTIAAPPRRDAALQGGADAGDRSHRLHRHGAEIRHRQAERRHGRRLKHARRSRAVPSPSAAIATCRAEMAMNTSSALWEMSRIPNRPTIREFMKAATPMNRRAQREHHGHDARPMEHVREYLLHHAHVGDERAEHHRHRQGVEHRDAVDDHQPHRAQYVRRISDQPVFRMQGLGQPQECAQPDASMRTRRRR